MLPNDISMEDQGWAFWEKASSPPAFILPSSKNAGHGLHEHFVIVDYCATPSVYYKVWKLANVVPRIVCQVISEIFTSHFAV